MPTLLTPQKPRFFAAPHKGRQILAGFSYLQRMRKSANTRVWVPQTINNQAVEWAAIREFDLLQEGDNLVIDDLNIFDMPRTLRALRSMQGGGYRVVMMTLGRYSDATAHDDLEILDKKLQDEITKMIHFLYLDELSKATSLFKHAGLEKPEWSCAEALPHVAQSLAEKKLFYPHKLAAEEELFLDLLEHLPSSHIVHDAAIGLTLPEAEKNKNWTYIAKGECQAMAFFNALGNVLDETITHHMRSSATHIRPEARHWQQRSAIALAA
ncbi:MAG: hypothetical protein AB7S81_03285 [Bdellovibrionales bacterium]